MERYLVYAVRYVKNPIFGDKHIDRVKMISEVTGLETEISRQEVVEKLRMGFFNNTEYYTYFIKNGKWTIGQKIILFERDYITTVHNNKKEDNLEELPEY